MVTAKAALALRAAVRSQIPHSRNATEETQPMAAPNLDSIPNSFEALKTNFKPEKAQGVTKAIQFDFSGREPGSWTMHLDNGAYSYHEGPAENPNATVEVDSDDWLKILKGETNAVSAFMSGKIKIRGDMSLMMAFQNWFERA
jgi:putative sterol carrier protein